MKKLLVLIISACLLLAGCSNQSSNEGSNSVSSEKSTKTDITKSTAEEIVNLLKDKVSTIDNIIVYTEETDANNLLGRPNQYTSKVNFADTREEQKENIISSIPSDPKGGSVEVFSNEDDCTKRAEYKINVNKNMQSMGSQYIYQYKNVLLRIDSELTPERAKEYETVFNQ